MVDAFYTEEKASKDIIWLLKDHVILLFTLGVEAVPDQGHLGVLHITNRLVRNRGEIFVFVEAELWVDFQKVISAEDTNFLERHNLRTDISLIRN